MDSMLSMPHDDAAQDKDQTLDLIKQTLMKVIDDMTQMEADRHLPDNHPMKNMSAKAPVAPMDDSAAPEMPESPDDESSEDSGMLDDMLGKASSSDDEGMMPEDHESDLPPEVADAIRKKKAQ